jgi:hypothetical protein
MPNDPHTTDRRRAHDAVQDGIEAASEAVSALPLGNCAWGQKEYMIAETAAKAAIAAFQGQTL